MIQGGRESTSYNILIPSAHFPAPDARSSKVQRLQQMRLTMNDAEFDGILARASDPNLIPGIYNYCDRRCDRCAFTSRCFHYLETCRAISAEHEERLSVGRVVARSLECSRDLLQSVGRRLGLDLIDRLGEAAGAGAAQPAEDATDSRDSRPTADPLLRIARKYAATTWPIVRALRPILQLRGEAALLEAMATLEAFSAGISAKVFRAVWNTSGSGVEDQVQNDANGSAKIARLMIGEARLAWRTLMEPGQATSDGVPARLVGLLDELDAGLASRFPNAMDFVRPGFDTAPSAKPQGAPALLLAAGVAAI